MNNKDLKITETFSEKNLTFEELLIKFLLGQLIKNGVGK